MALFTPYSTSSEHKVEQEGKQMDRLHFVNSLVLADITSECVLTSTGKLPKLADKKSEGYVNAGSLVSFTEKLTGQNKEDVLNSALLSQLAANKKHNRQTEADKWYREYTNVLMKIGWVVQDFTFSEYNSNQESFEISKVVVELLLSLVGDEEPLMIDVAKKTLAALKKSSSDTIKLFGSNSSSVKSGNFQIVPCTVSKNGQVNVSFVGCYFNASSVKNDFLFFTYQGSEIKLNKSTDTFTLNEEAYAQVRQAIVEKLGTRAKQSVKDLDI